MCLVGKSEKLIMCFRCRYHVFTVQYDVAFVTLVAFYRQRSTGPLIRGSEVRHSDVRIGSKESRDNANWLTSLPNCTSSNYPDTI